MTDVTFVDSLKIIGRGAFAIALGALLGLLCAYLFLSFLTPHYKGTMLIGPVDTLGSNGLAVSRAEDSLYETRQTSRNQNNLKNINFLRFENIVTGVSVAKALIQREDIRRGLSAHSHFSIEQDTWSAAELSQYLKKRIRLDPVGETALRTMIYYHPNPEFSAHFLRVLHDVTD